MQNLPVGPISLQNLQVGDNITPHSLYMFIYHIAVQVSKVFLKHIHSNNFAKYVRVPFTGKQGLLV
jgi:hypothetical protein